VSAGSLNIDSPASMAGGGSSSAVTGGLRFRGSASRYFLLSDSAFRVGRFSLGLFWIFFVRDNPWRIIRRLRVAGGSFPSAKRFWFVGICVKDRLKTI